MRVRAKLTLRNEKMIAARKKLGLSQIKLANIMGFKTVVVIQRLEAFRYPKFYNDKLVLSLAYFLGISPDDVWPEELAGHMLESEMIAFVDLTPKQLTEVGKLPALPARDATDNEFIKTRIGQVLATLTYREREIIKLRYGLGDGYAYTLEEVSRIFQVTKERVRQVETKALRKLQDPFRSEQLESCVGINRKDRDGTL